MRSRRPAPTDHRLRRPPAVLAAVLAGGMIAGLALAGPAAASRPTVGVPGRGAALSARADGGHSSLLASGPPGADGTVTGEVERVSVDDQTQTLSGHPTATSTMIGGIRSGTRDLAVPASSLDGIPSGSEVTAQLEPAARVTASATGGTPSVGTVQHVRSIRVLATARPPVRRAGISEPQSVTLLMALPDGTRADGTSLAALASTIGTGVATFWSQQSGGKITFAVSRRVGWTSLTHSCSDIWGLWDEARTKIGFVAGRDRHLVVYVPAAAGCPTGLGTVGTGVDAGGNVLVGGTTTGLLAHELGHNLGLGHSNALKCVGVSDGVYVTSGYTGGCHSVEYGDWYDVMGISWDNLGTLSTAQAYRLGLLGAADVRTVSGPTRATLRAVSGHTGLRSLRIHDPAGATYVVEYRPASGADAWLDTAADWRGLRPGVLVRRVDPTDPTQTLLLDPTPQATETEADNDWDVALTAGQSLVTASGRVRILVEATSAGSAVVSVRVDGESPGTLALSGGRLVNGAQVTVAQAQQAWAAARAH